jgi:O-antigen/teichoic acid export membrane protein
MLAGIYLGVAATGILDLAEKFPVLASQLPATMNSVFLPTLSHWQTQEQHEAMRNLYQRGTRYLNLLTGLLMGFLSAFAAPLMLAWIGADERFSLAATVFAMMTLPYQMHEVTGPSSALHRATGKPLRELVYPLSQLALVALTITGGFFFFGKSLLVICGAVAVSMTASSLIYLSYTHRLLGLTQRQLWRNVMWPGLLPYACGWAVRWCFPAHFGFVRWQILAVLFGAGLVYAAVVLPVVWLGVGEEDERAQVRQQVHALAQRLGWTWQTAPASVE